MGVALKTSYLTIPVSDFQQSIAWYGEHFGFKVVTEDPFYVEMQNESGIRILLQQNEHNLHSHFVENPHSSPPCCPKMGVLGGWPLVFRAV